MPSLQFAITYRESATIPETTTQISIDPLQKNLENEFEWNTIPFFGLAIVLFPVKIQMRAESLSGFVVLAACFRLFLKSHTLRMVRIEL